MPSLSLSLFIYIFMYMMQSERFFMFLLAQHSEPRVTLSVLSLDSLTEGTVHDLDVDEFFYSEHLPSRVCRDFLVHDGACSFEAESLDGGLVLLGKPDGGSLERYSVEGHGCLVWMGVLWQSVP